jgi:hypothetical protein
MQLSRCLIYLVNLLLVEMEVLLPTSLLDIQQIYSLKISILESANEFGMR